MNIYLSGFSHLNSVYSHESGQVLYKVSTPIVLGSRTSTIYKVQPTKTFDIAEPAEDEVVISDDDLKDKFMEWGTVEHKAFGSSVMKFDGQVLETLSFFRKEKDSPRGRYRIFTGPDGKEYRWYLDWISCKLCLNDEAKTPVAKFHRRSLGIIGKKAPPYLEIFPPGLGIVDTILITFLYIEKKRDDGGRRSPINSVYTHESGQVLYKVDTPLALGSRTSTIYKILPNVCDPPHYERFDPGDLSDSEEDSKTPELSDTLLKDKFSVLATIEHKLIGFSILKFGGKTLKTTDYFRKDGLGVHGRHRIFTGPDGREYKWYLKPTTSHLYLNDKAETPVAKFHEKSFGIIGKKHPAYLEIFPDGVQILDTILITFIYVEKKRKDREREKRTHAD